MEGDLHGVALVALFILCLAVCRRYGTRPQAVLPAGVLCLAAGLLIAELVMGVVCHGLVLTLFKPADAMHVWLTCLAHQGVVLGVCLGLCLMFLPLQYAQRIVVVGVFLVLFGVSGWHLSRLNTDKHLLIPSVLFTSVRENARVGGPSSRWHTWLTGVLDCPRRMDLQQVRQIAVPIADGHRREIQPQTLPSEPVEWGSTFQLSPPNWACHAALQANLNALGMLLVVLLTMLLLLGRRTEIGIRHGWQPFFGLALAVFVLMATLDQNSFIFGPSLQCLVPAISIGLLGVCLPKHERREAGAFFVLFLLAILLTAHADAVKRGVFGQGIYNAHVRCPSFEEPKIVPAWHSLLTGLYYEDTR